MPDIITSDQKVEITPSAGKRLTLDGVGLHKISQTVLYSQFTDGGAAVGTLVLTEKIPAEATVLHAAVKNITGFAGNTSAALTIGDGSDVDRYNTGTPSVFASAPGGVAMGIPSGVKYHTAEQAVTLTVTGGTDFTNISAGAMPVEITSLT